MKVILCGFKSILNTDEYFRSTTISKGHSLFFAGHVDSVKEEINNDSSTVFGQCLPQTSINKEPYKIKLQLSTSRNILGGTCSCKVGLGGVCKHLAALATFVNDHRETSKTDQPQSWGIPHTRSGYSKGKRLAEMFPAPTTPHVDAFQVPVLSLVSRLPEDSPLLKIAESEYKTSMDRDCRAVLTEIVSNVCKEELSIIMDIVLKNAAESAYYTYESRVENDKIYLSRRAWKISGPEKMIYESKICVDTETIKEIALSTIGQHKSPLWHRVRKYRITSSQCHAVKTRKANFDKLVSRFLSNAFKGNLCTVYGQKLEAAARASFAFRNGVRVTEMGAVICQKYPWLSCSPDGIYYNGNEIELLEIKCPYSRKGEKLVDHERKTSYLPYVYYGENNFELKQSHQYYSQIQISLYILNLHKCSLYIYSSVDNLKLDISRNDSFLSDLIPTLETFYFTHFLPVLSHHYQ